MLTLQEGRPQQREEEDQDLGGLATGVTHRGKMCLMDPIFFWAAKNCCEKYSTVLPKMAAWAPGCKKSRLCQCPTSQPDMALLDYHGRYHLHEGPHVAFVTWRAKSVAVLSSCIRTTLVKLAQVPWPGVLAG